MKIGKLAAMCITATAIVACDNTTNTSEVSSASGKRVISNALIATCPQNSAGRSTEDTLPLNTTYINKRYPLTTKIYNQNGEFIVNVDAQITSDTMPSINSIKLLWNGRDSLNVIVPTGNYFFFKTLTDTENNRSITDSSCIKWVRG